MATASRVGWCAALVLAATGLEAGERPDRGRVEATSAPAVREWSRRIDRLLDGRQLSVRQVRADTMIAGRRHERLAQLYRGVPVWGGELAVQSDAAGPLSVFGRYYEGIDVEVAPRLRGDDVEAMVARRG